jgi:hypothetical protein
MEVVQLFGQGQPGDNGGLSVFVYEDIVGVDVAYLLFEQFELITRSDQVVQDVPDLSLVEVLVEVVAVLYLTAEDELELGVGYLTVNKGEYLWESIAPAHACLFEGLGLGYQEELMAFSVVDFLELVDPAFVLVLFDDVACDLHFGDFLSFPVLVLLTEFKDPNGA